MVGVKHCCFGICKSDSRYPNKLPEGVHFYPFVKKHINLDKCLKWTNACGRQDFGLDNITKYTYICGVHFVGGKGPTLDHPDPIPASYSTEQKEKFCRKRKSPPSRYSLRKRLKESDTPTSNDDTHSHTDENSGVTVKIEESTAEQSIATNNQSTQTTAPITARTQALIDHLLTRNELTKIKAENERLTPGTSMFGYNTVKETSKMFKFYTNLTVPQFDHLLTSLDDATKNIKYHRGKSTHEDKDTNTTRPGPKIKMSLADQLFLTLVRLRRGFSHQELAYRFNICTATVSRIVITWVQLLYKMFKSFQNLMFASLKQVQKHAPPCFKKFKTVRVIVDCTEIFVQAPRNFHEQDNVYSNYKHHATFKFLVGIAPNGAITYVSDTYEGAVSDKDLFLQCGITGMLQPGDMVMADRGFTIRDELYKQNVDLNIPPFLHGGDHLTPQEEMATKRIARLRKRVEKAFKRIKGFRLLKHVLPVTLRPIVSEIVYVCSCLVNYQEP